MYWIGSAISCLISIGCLIGGISALVTRRRQRATFMPATGTVIGLQRQIINPGSSGVYCPTVEFATPSGEMIRFESSFGTMPASHKVGQLVKVLYDPNNPGKAEIDSGLTNWLVPGCLLVFALGACFFSFMFLGLYFIMSSGA